MNWHTIAMLIALAGLPGTGKTSIARSLAAEFNAVHLRIDAIGDHVARWMRAFLRRHTGTESALLSIFRADADRIAARGSG